MDHTTVIAMSPNRLGGAGSLRARGFTAAKPL